MRSVEISVMARILLMAEVMMSINLTFTINTIDGAMANEQFVLQWRP